MGFYSLLINVNRARMTICVTGYLFVPHICRHCWIWMEGMVETCVGDVANKKGGWGAWTVMADILNVGNVC